MTREDMGIYLGFAKCGCLVAVVVDDPEDPEGTSIDVAEFVRDGLRVERCTPQEFMSMPFGHQPDCSARTQKELALF